VSAAVPIAVVIPARNEQEALPLVLSEIPGDLVDRIVVVDNGSDDDTAGVARAAGAEVVEESRPGYGGACQAGLAHLTESPPAVVVFLDGDHSDYPEDMRVLLEPILEGSADFVCGSRVDLAGPGVLPPQVRWGNGLATRLIALLFGHSYSDMGPFRAIRWEALERLRMRDTAYGWNAEMQVKALQRGLRVLEVPVRYRQRIGSSKISGTMKGTLLAGHGIIWTILALRFLPGRQA
jgi:glycosyltransferase involved in cell wall biosynthesis